MTAKKSSQNRGLSKTGQTWVAVAAVAVLLGMLGFLAIRQEGTTKVPGGEKEQLDAGTVLFEQGMKDEGAGQLEQANLHYEQARKDFESVLAKSPNDPLACFRLGALSARQGRNAEAEALFRRSLIQGPTNALAHGSLGILLLQAGNPREARSELETAIGLNSNYPGALYHLGVIAMNEGRIPDAVDYYRRELVISPNDGMAQYNLGVILMTMNKTDEAIEHLGRSVDLIPGNAMVHCGLGTALQQSGRFSEAIGQFEEALKIQPELQLAASSLGQIAWALSTDPDPKFRNGLVAMSVAQHAVQVSHGGDPLILSQLAAACGQMGDFKQAVSVAENALKLSTDQKKTELADQIRAELEFYRKEEPFLLPSRNTNATPPSEGK